MTLRPETRYAWSGDVCLAYQVLGQGPLDLLYVQGYCSNVDLGWEGRHLSRFLRGLNEHGRLILTDRRGWGCSDRFSARDVQDIDAYVDDVSVVLDAAASDRALIVASGESALLACLFAAGHPSRTSGLVLIDAFPTYSWTPETPWALTPEQWREGAAGIRKHWGSQAWVHETSAGQVDERELDWFARYMRSSITPAALAAEMERYVGTDIRSVLPAVHVPSLVFVDLDGTWENVPEASRYVAAHVPGARSVELASGQGPNVHGLHWYSRAESILREIGSFVDGLREEESSFDRVLATVLFTDIVDSTVQATSLGDRRWREIREEHDAIVRAQLARFRGREVKTMGDGFLATFDGPARAVRCAIAIASAITSLGIDVRTGLHTGEVELDGEDIAGLAVAIGARVGALAGPSEVLVSQTVRDLVSGSGLSFDDAGEHELKGIPDRWRLYRVVS
ncbi:MAG TPA: adenylate/guanylate cyclase domain-containing protein [Actinomycetota bacterium]|nr:adenylate/guanylate cyclase domain-containing protein [Actinomycetota bacterium]